MTQATSWKDDDELFSIARNELYTAVVGDIMDKMGLIHQFLPPEIRPLRDDMFLIGRAMTVLEADCIENTSPDRTNPALRKPFGLMLESYALWGELMTARAICCGATGAVTNGYTRDTKGILALDFPTFSYGPYAQDQSPRGKVIDYRCPIEMDGVAIRSGDIVIGDIDGVCIVPQESEEEVFRGALEKARGEKTVKKAIEAGMTASEAFAEYGIL